MHNVLLCIPISVLKKMTGIAPLGSAMDPNSAAAAMSGMPSPGLSPSNFISSVSRESNKNTGVNSLLSNMS